MAPISQSQPLVSMDDPSSLIDSLIALTDAIKSNPVFPIEKKLLLTLSDAQTLTGLGKATLKRAIKEGQLKAIRLGGSWRIKPADLEGYINGL
ncbi:helix-turn-helix domain-containing protein [Crocosphaera sp. Alani8]|uniref:helix-turn-helix domain-containing protein n=1 Tax=Crocosphaera sp. Alani8 TaxID=3038952 RepID=UPI00313C9283